MSRVKHDMNKAMDNIPGLKKILPTEYGGQGGSLNSIAGMSYFYMFVSILIIIEKWRMVQ